MSQIKEFKQRSVRLFQNVQTAKNVDFSYSMLLFFYEYDMWYYIYLNNILNYPVREIRRIQGQYCSSCLITVTIFNCKNCRLLMSPHPNHKNISYELTVMKKMIKIVLINLFFRLNIAILRSDVVDTHSDATNCCPLSCFTAI